MKWSKYNVFINNGDGRHLLYNCATDNILVFVADIRTILSENMGCIDNIEKIHPDLFNCLINKEYIIKDDINEIQALIEKKEKVLNSEDYFRLTLNPTMNCNLKCWYCYESHKPKSFINNKIMNALKLLLKDKIENPNIKNIALSFFGGEPLLEFNSTVLPLIHYTENLCDQYTKNLHIGFTSNSTLLTQKVTESLASTGLDIEIQVPFDGGKDFHDKVKKFPNGKGTYDITIKNIKYALTKGLRFNIRCNYTIENLQSFRNLIDDFQNYIHKYPSFIRFSFQQIWQVADNKEKTIPIIKELKKTLEEYGITSMKENMILSAKPCYADRPDSIVINYDGNIYKCTARDFLPELKEGVLNENGTITYNEQYKKRMYVRFSNEICLDCIIFPICNICSQKRLEHGNICLLNINDEEKQILIRDRLKIISTDEINEN